MNGFPNSSEAAHPDDSTDFFAKNNLPIYSLTRLETSVSATPEARNAIHCLTEDFGPIMFYQPGGPEDGFLPICLEMYGFIFTEKDILLGRIDHTSVYVDKREAERWKNSRLLIDVATGEPDGFSIAAGEGLHFVSKAQIVNLEFYPK